MISPAALAAVAPDPARAPDRLSARWLLALAAQLVRDVGDLITGATRAQRKLATFAMDGTVRFASAAERAAFTAELMQAVTSLVAKYHDEQAEADASIIPWSPSIRASRCGRTPAFRKQDPDGPLARVDHEASPGQPRAPGAIQTPGYRLVVHGPQRATQERWRCLGHVGEYTPSGRSPAGLRLAGAPRKRPGAERLVHRTSS